MPHADAAPAPGERLGAPLDAESEGVLVPDGLGPREAEGVVEVEGEAVPRTAEGEPLGEAVAVAVELLLSDSCAALPARRNITSAARNSAGRRGI